MRSLNIYSEIMTLGYRIFFLNVIFIMSMSSSWAQSCAGVDCKVQVQFKGTYVQDTCDISINNGTSSETVTLPTLSSATLQQDGAEGGSGVFNVTLKNCPAGKTIMLQFVSGMSASDTQTGNLVNTAGSNYSSNVQVRIRKSDNTQIKIDDSNTMQDYVIDTAGNDVTHAFVSSYYAKGNHAVTAGDVKAIAGIELYYK